MKEKEEYGSQKKKYLKYKGQKAIENDNIIV